MLESIRSNWRDMIRLGLLAGGLTFGMSVIGMVETFSSKELIHGVLSVGYVLVFAAPMGIGYLFARNNAALRRPVLLVNAFLVGLISVLPIILLVFMVRNIDLQDLGLINMTTTLGDMLTFNLNGGLGFLLLIILTSISGLLGAAVNIMPDQIRRPVITGLIWTLGVGLFSEVAITALRRL
ncbi:MAG: hypothetical protein GTO14_14600, partial [Anaerolineales bacterium]|nr:hypothetical protein [Anaerolineales bacterium]